MPPPYVADTNVYVRAVNEPAFRERFEHFVRLHGPLLVSSIVIAEVVIGVADSSRHEAVVRALSAGTSALAPRVDDWLVAASVVARLGGEAITKTRSFWNDALLASQCAGLRATLVTSNTRDFRRLRRLVPVEVREPFP